jgi:hypothetical protein
LAADFGQFLRRTEFVGLDFGLEFERPQRVLAGPSERRRRSNMTSVKGTQPFV